MTKTDGSSRDANREAGKVSQMKVQGLRFRQHDEVDDLAAMENADDGGTTFEDPRGLASKKADAIEYNKDLHTLNAGTSNATPDQLDRPEGTTSASQQAEALLNKQPNLAIIMSNEADGLPRPALSEIPALSPPQNALRIPLNLDIMKLRNAYGQQILRESYMNESSTHPEFLQETYSGLDSMMKNIYSPRAPLKMNNATLVFEDQSTIREQRQPKKKRRSKNGSQLKQHMKGREMIKLSRLASSNGRTKPRNQMPGSKKTKKIFVQNAFEQRSHSKEVDRSTAVTGVTPIEQAPTAQFGVGGSINIDIPIKDGVGREWGLKRLSLPPESLNTDPAAGLQNGGSTEGPASPLGHLQEGDGPHGDEAADPSMRLQKQILTQRHLVQKGKSIDVLDNEALDELLAAGDVEGLRDGVRVQKSANGHTLNLISEEQSQSFGSGLRGREQEQNSMKGAIGRTPLMPKVAAMKQDHDLDQEQDQGIEIEINKQIEIQNEQRGQLGVDGTRFVRPTVGSRAKDQDHIRIQTSCLLPKIQVVHPLQGPQESRQQSTIERTNIDLARRGKYCQPRTDMKQSKSDQKEALRSATKIKYLKQMIEKQIDSELGEEFERQRELPENDNQSNKQLWANVMLNHVHRVTNVLQSLKAQGRMKELNSVEGVAKMLGIPESKAFETQYLKEMNKDQSVVSLHGNSFASHQADGRHYTLGSPGGSSPPKSIQVNSFAVNSPADSRGSHSGDGELLQNELIRAVKESRVRTKKQQQVETIDHQQNNVSIFELRSRSHVVSGRTSGEQSLRTLEHSVSFSNVPMIGMLSPTGMAHDPTTPKNPSSGAKLLQQLKERRSGKLSGQQGLQFYLGSGPVVLPPRQAALIRREDQKAKYQTPVVTKKHSMKANYQSFATPVAHRQQSREQVPVNVSSVDSATRVVEGAIQYRPSGLLQELMLSNGSTPNDRNHPGPFISQSPSKVSSNSNLLPQIDSNKFQKNNRVVHARIPGIGHAPRPPRRLAVPLQGRKEMSERLSAMINPEVTSELAKDQASYAGVNTDHSNRVSPVPSAVKKRDSGLAGQDDRTAQVTKSISPSLLEQDVNISFSGHLRPKNAQPFVSKGAGARIASPSPLQAAQIAQRNREQQHAPTFKSSPIFQSNLAQASDQPSSALPFVPTSMGQGQAKDRQPGPQPALLAPLQSSSPSRAIGAGTAAPPSPSLSPASLNFKRQQSKEVKPRAGTLVKKLALLSQRLVTSAAKPGDHPVDLQIQGQGGWRPGQRLYSIGSPALSPLKNTRFVINQNNDSPDFVQVLADEAPLISPDLESQPGDDALIPTQERPKTGGSERQQPRKRKQVLNNPGGAATRGPADTQSCTNGSFKVALARSTFADEPKALSVPNRSASGRRQPRELLHEAA